MARKRAVAESSESAVESSEAMTSAIVLPDMDVRQIPVSSIIIDGGGAMASSYVDVARAKLFMLRQGDRTHIPKVSPIPGGRYSVIHFEVA